MERTGATGQPSEFPPGYVAIEAVLDRTFVDRTEPEALHGEEELDEDDSFLSVGSETWDYEIADGRQGEFLDALKNSQVAMECVPLDD